MFRFLNRFYSDSGPLVITQYSKVFVKWLHMPASLATWEDAEHLREQFPFAPAWGHAATQDGGNVSTTTNQDSEHQKHQDPIEPSSPGVRRPDGEAAEQAGLSSPGVRQPNGEAGEQAGSSSLGEHRPMKPNTRFFGPVWSNK